MTTTTTTPCANSNVSRNAPDNTTMEINDEEGDIMKGYANDKLFNLITKDMAKYPSFNMKDNTLWTKNIHSNEVICIPRERKIITQILDKAHSILGHFGDERTCEYI